MRRISVAIMDIMFLDSRITNRKEQQGNKSKARGEKEDKLRNKK